MHKSEYLIDLIIGYCTSGHYSTIIVIKVIHLVAIMLDEPLGFAYLMKFQYLTMRHNVYSQAVCRRGTRKLSVSPFL